MKTEHNNAFDYARILAAILVLISHHFALYGGGEPLFFGYTKLGTACVIIFFAISGYLITASFCTSSSIKEYFIKRALRIFPALIVCSVMMTVFACSFFGKFSAKEYWSGIQPIHNIIKYSLLDASGSGSVTNYFGYNYRFPNVLNGSLWTLFYEVFDYIAIAIALLIFTKIKFIGTFILLIGSISLQALINHYHINQPLIDRSTILTIPFAVGSILFHAKRVFNTKKLTILILLLSLLLIFIFSHHENERSVSFYSFLPVSVISLCFLLSPYLKKINFDYSYGVYIYAYPIQQIVINEIGFNFINSLIFSIFITLFFASISWHFVESKAIKFKERIR